MAELDAIVIGSGFGGAVTACRLAQERKTVLILERGPRYGGANNKQFSTVSFKLLATLQALAGGGTLPDFAGLLWNPNRGIFDIKRQGKMVAIQAAGYGGGSLIYANVHVEPPPSTFDDGWPSSIHVDSLKPYYDLVSYMLNVAPITTGRPPVKTTVMQQVAKSLARDAQLFYPNLAVNFGQKADTFQKTYRAPGQCDYHGGCFMGCSVQAKNSLDFNYLKVAEDSGHVTVLTNCQATRIAAKNGFYKVTYTDLSAGSPAKTAEAEAPHIFLCAGALSSTELLLRCRDEFVTLPNLSPHLGRKLSGNGDFLAFAFNTGHPVKPSDGPTITSAIIYDRKIVNERFWFLLEDGGYPDGLSDIIGLLNPRLGRDKIGGAFRQISAGLKTVWPSLPLPNTPISSLPGADNTMVFLLMGRDRGDGTMRLTPGKRQAWIDWHTEANLPLYDVEQELALQFASDQQALAGTFAANPLWRLFRLSVSVHNLGGCPMAEYEGDGVVDEFGNVFGYPGLHILDGSIVPRALGVNPAHTIAALAERGVEHTIREITGNKGWKALQMDDAAAASSKAGDPIRAALPKKQTAKPNIAGEITIAFSERLRDESFNGSDLAELEVDITTPLLDEFMVDPEHTCTMTGIFRADGFTTVSGARFQNGVFKLFVPTKDDNFYARQMHYKFDFTGNNGTVYKFEGIKQLKDPNPTFARISDWLKNPREALIPLKGMRRLSDLASLAGGVSWFRDRWRSLTTLVATIKEPNGQEVAQCRLSLSWDQFLKQLTTFQVNGPRSDIVKVRELERFGRLFFGTLFDLYVRDRLHSKGG